MTIVSLVAVASAQSWKLDRLDGLTPQNSTLTVTKYLGRKALHPVALAGHDINNEDMMVLASNSQIHNGTIDVDVAGKPRPDANAAAKGFLGIAFRVQDDGQKYEIFYLRPVNARANDQLQRNHTVQYQSAPDYSWQRLRRDTPGVYESYIDAVPGTWTHLRISVSGNSARLFVGGATEPCLIVNDLKLGDSNGSIALWAYANTDAYFSDLSVRNDR